MAQLVLKLTVAAVLCLSTCQARPADEEKKADVAKDAVVKAAEPVVVTPAAQEGGAELKSSDASTTEVYGEFPEEKIKIPSVGCKTEGGVDKCQAFPYLNQAEGGLDYMTIPTFPLGYGAPLCPALYGPNSSTPWGCYPYPAMPCNYTPFFGHPGNFYPAFYPMMPLNFPYPANMSLGYGFGPHPLAACGPHNINRTFIEQSLRNPKAFEKLKNCSYC